MFSIYIPSKGRAGKSGTIKLLTQEQIDFTILVEPQECLVYERAYPSAKIINIGENDKGIAYVRNFALNEMRKSGGLWCWMLDDDIKGFYESNANGKTTSVSAYEALSQSEKIFATTPLAQVGLSYKLNAWTKPKEFVLNTSCVVCTCINVEKTIYALYRNNVVLKGDLDFTLQLLTASHSTMRISRFCFDVPKNGGGIGGLSSLYADGVTERQSIFTMAKLWPGICNIRKNANGSIGVSVNWHLIKRLSKFSLK